MPPNLLAFFVVLYQKFCVFIIFICCIDEVPNFRKRILTNQKSELGIRNQLSVELHVKYNNLIDLILYNSDKPDEKKSRNILMSILSFIFL